jgi:TonB family protein
MKESDKIRFVLATIFSFLAHFTALIFLIPFYVVLRASKALFAEENENLRIALLLAVLLHITVLLPLIYWGLAVDDEILESDLFSVDLWDADKAAEEEEKSPEEQLEAYEPEEQVPEGQVVEAPASEDVRRPDRARFLAEQDARVEKETRSQIRRPATGQAVSSPALVGKGTDEKTDPGGLRSDQHGPPAPPVPETADQGEKAPTPRRAPASLLDINLAPSRESLSSALAGSGLDHLEDVALGEATALNTRGWKFAAFFNRVKRQVEQRWHPAREYRQRDPYGNIYGFKDRGTVLLVVLRRDGSLKKAYVMTPSGAAFLDDEAREAVEAAAPFPHVPGGLVDQRDGLVKFTFHFVVEVGEQPIFRMRRYR